MKKIQFNSEEKKKTRMAYFRMSEEEYKEVSTIAHKENVPLSILLRSILRDFLK